MSIINQLNQLHQTAIDQQIIPAIVLMNINTFTDLLTTTYNHDFDPMTQRAQIQLGFFGTWKEILPIYVSKHYKATEPVLLTVAQYEAFLAKHATITHQPFWGTNREPYLNETVYLQKDNQQYTVSAIYTHLDRYVLNDDTLCPYRICSIKDLYYKK